MAKTRLGYRVLELIDGCWYRVKESEILLHHCLKPPTWISTPSSHYYAYIGDAEEMAESRAKECGYPISVLKSGTKFFTMSSVNVKYNNHTVLSQIIDSDANVGWIVWNTYTLESFEEETV